MKVKWRQHGIILVSMLAVVAVIHDLWIALHLTQQQMQRSAFSFLQNHRPFNYYYNFLIPQIGSIVFLYGCYLWVGLVIVPKIHLDKLPKTGIQTFKRFVWIIFQLLIICILLGPCVNFASFYINPYTLHYGVNYFPLTFGSHPQPFANAFGGLDTSIGMVVIYMVCISIREVIIYYVEQSAYRVMVTNVVTLVMGGYFGVLILVSTFQLGGNYWDKFYEGCMPSILILILSNIYWLFPSNGGASLFKWKIVLPLLFTSFVYTLIFSRFLGEEWSFIHFTEIWAFEILVITPVSWFAYKGQQDRILQMRGMEKALVKSTADLQFLRSQINPHFLFNALNTLYGTALMDGSKNTAAGIQKLGDMMRFMLHENNQDFIPMDKEVEYLKNYIALQKLRTQVSPDIIIEDSITVDNSDHQIAPMLLIPFVENAFKHGIGLETASRIKISLNCRAGHILFEVRNSVHTKQDNDPERDKSGIGLNNVLERLKLVYPGKHIINITENENEFFVRLEIQLT